MALANDSWMIVRQSAASNIILDNREIVTVSDAAVDAAKDIYRADGGYAEMSGNVVADAVRRRDPVLLAAIIAGVELQIENREAEEEAKFLARLGA